MGRTRTFDLEDAVIVAAKLFWRGYDQTSLTDLTEALNVAPASFYYAFESKEALFRKVVERYVTMRDESFNRAFEAPTTTAGVEAMLRSYVDILTDPAHTPGCLVVNNFLSGMSDESLNKWLVGHRKTFRTMLEHQFAKDVANGRLPLDVDVKEAAGFVVTFSGGLAVEAKSGTKRKQLYRMIDYAMDTVGRLLREPC